MKNDLYAKMKADRKIFKNNVNSDNDVGAVLSEHYPMLERCIRQSAKECGKAGKHLKDPELLPGLFDKCIKLCHDGILPDQDGIVEFFKGELNGICIEYLPLAITCALLHGCAYSVTEISSENLKKYVRSLQKMRETDFDYISERLFSAEEILMDDPAGIYGCTDKESKARYRRKITSLSIKNKKTECETAEAILRKAEEEGKHIGNYLFTTVRSRRYGVFFLVAEALIPALICVASGILSGEWLSSLLLYFPLWEILRYFFESASMKRSHSRKLLRIDSDSEKVSDVHALMVLSVILPSADRISEIKDKLENLYLSNASGNIGVCCLGDFKGADAPIKPEDKYIPDALKKAIEELNKKYGGGFIAAVRPRSYSETQNEFIGKERKRGAIRALVRAIKGNDKEFSLLTGDTDRLEKTKYLIVLDYDSRPVFDSVRELIAVAEHPVNKPVIKNGKVVSGYGILAPGLQTSLDSARTFFGSIMSGDTGISSYDENSSERYQTLFGESVFCGKGLINVDAYYELLDNTLPKEKILSHDIIEGEYLRTGFVSEVQIIEDFPDTTEAYYKRLHRWVRGDWQNSGFIFQKNPLGFVSRFKLFDNLRRSITPAVCLGIIICSSFYHGYSGIVAAVIASFALCSSDVFSGINNIVHSGIRSFTGLYYSKKLPEALRCFTRAFFLLSYSAREAFVCLDAILKSLWRLLVSGDNLLEWTPSASRNKEKTADSLVSCVPALIVSGILIIFGLPIHRLVGLIILGDIPLTFFVNSLLHGRKSDITASQRDYLMSQASAIWGFFEDFCTEQNNYLPPDNIQFAPKRAIAKRTSPTNIGLMLACFLAARDFGLISSEELCNRLETSLRSIEKLEKYKGNLMNWYDISTLETLSPRFVSAVDSGNFLCCLTAVKEGIREYESECEDLKPIAEKIEKIISSTDLGVMYNARRNLFHIGINPDSAEKTESFYDLYMSEIRMTAYLAVARKTVPKEHWGALDRPFIRSGRYTGLASWTGTMFEYFMADIFVPSPEGSLSNEALNFCLQRQRKKAGKNPFGISESAFYSFDGDLNYQYKAHGVQKLGLKRGLDKENVISPYSTFLTLNIAPQLSLKNLKKLEKFGMTGKYGFYEALDFTEGRNNGSFSVVNSFMVHHIAMSFLSIDNLINGNCMQKRFMKDGYMKGAETILEEKAVQGKEVFRDVVSDTVMTRPRERYVLNKSSWYCPDKKTPKFYVFTNGRMTLCVSDTGISEIIFDGERFENALDMDFYETGMQVRAEKNSICFRKNNTDIHTAVEIFLLKNSNCVVMRYKSENRSKTEVSVNLNLEEEKSFNQNNVHFKCGVINTGESAEGKETILKGGESKETIFAVSADTDVDDATNMFEVLKTGKNNNKKASNPFWRDEFQRALADKLLHKIISGNSKYDETLTKYGLSAEHPLLLKTIESIEQIGEIDPAIKFNKILRTCGIKNTLVIFNNLHGNEKNTVLQTIETVLHEESCELMLGIGGGVVVFEQENRQNCDSEKIKKIGIEI